MEQQVLKNLADIQTGPFGSQLHKEDYVGNGTPIVTVEHLGARTFTEQNLPKVSDSDKKRLSKYILCTGDIVFSRVGSVDRCSFANQAHDGWMFSGRCLRVRPNEKIDPLYLYYFFCLEETKQFVRNIAVGATMPSINTKLLGEVPISYPDIESQRKITGTLSVIDSKIELNQRINDNLSNLLQSLYQERFGCAIIPCDEFSCPKFTNRDTINWTFRGRIGTTGLTTRRLIMAELTYTKVGDYYIPDLILDEDPAIEKFYGKYGDLRRSYLREHKPKLWMMLVNTGRADDHLTSIEQEAERRMDALLPQFMKSDGVTEELKACDQMAWVGLVNNCKARVEELIMAELIFN